MPIPFKTWLQKKSVYKGGKSKSEITTHASKIFKLSSNENPLGASPKAIAAIQTHLNSLDEYPDRTDRRLRIALSDFYQNKLSPDQFITFNSGVTGLFMLMQGILVEGTECIFSSPGFTPYRVFPTKLGAKSIDIPLKADDFQLDVEGILQAITPQTRLVFITSPNNPTGTHLPKNDVDALIYQLPDHVILVFDEVYYQFVDATDYTRALPYVLEGKNIIALNSFSKAYGLAGMRIGYAYSTPEIAQYYHQLYIPFMINTLSTEAAIAALQDDEFIEKTVQHIHREKKYLYQEFDKLGIKYWKTQANFIFVKPTVSPEQLEQMLLEEGIMVRPAAAFSAPDYVRITIGTREANETLVKAWQKLGISG